ncbi:MAG TPA: rod shape-determining protein MreC [Terriglobales bacterium]|nr:rod shape-determining protein MreC [Terriglobales bacterium]
MEHLISRYRNLTILTILLFAQVLGLAIQVKRSSDNTPTRLIRIWAVDAVTPFEKGIVWLENGVRNLWRGYFYLRGVRQENRALKQQIEQLQIERASLNQDAEQAHRLQALLGFKERYISKTLAAQVIGSSGSEQSRSIYIDKGSRDGIKPDQAVITADGVVGKILRGVQDHVASVLLINDQTSGVGAILATSRLQGVLRGSPTGEVVLEKVMSDEAVEQGEKVLTSGGDRIFPKGLAVGTVVKVSPGPELFLNIRVKPAADLDRLEEVLVITDEELTEPAEAAGEHLRAADILAQRLPSIPDQPAPSNPNAPPPPTFGLKIQPPPNRQAPTPSAVSAAAKTGQTEAVGQASADRSPAKPKPTPVLASPPRASGDSRSAPLPSEVQPDSPKAQPQEPQPQPATEQPPQ